MATITTIRRCRRDDMADLIKTAIALTSTSLSVGKPASQIIRELKTMEQLIARIVANVGLEPDVAEKAVGMILGFLQREADDAAVARMIEAIPGGPELVAEFNGEGSGGLLSAIGGGVMALGQQLMGAGLGMGEISGVARETIAFAKEHAGADVVDQVVASVPGLSQFV